MPRRFDFSGKPTPDQYEKYGLFLPLLADGKPVMRAGEREYDYAEIWPQDDPAAMFRGPRHQYTLRSIPGTKYYDNEFLDEVHEWIGANLSGRWHWHESEINNYRSIGFSVYIQDEADREAFEARWGERFERSQHAMAHNEGLIVGRPTP